MKYRPDIDGLRAIAVLGITVFHINPERLAGGYVGVDVFFVISGFLITSIIRDETAAGEFSLLNFYAKRARRLFPALFAMLLVTSVIASILLLPSELAGYGHSLVSAILYYSNFHFLSQSGYFDGGRELNPLLHTWSLSVEEQFYVIFPVLLLLFLKLRGRMLIALGIFAIVSLALSEWLVREYPDAAFYISPSRFWQFLCGSLVALAPASTKLPRSAADVMLGAGLLLLAACYLLFDEATPVPGLAALMPTLAGAMIILAGRLGDSPLALLLSASPLRFLGRISYSVYLWHWPLIVFFRLAFPSLPGWIDNPLLLLGSLVLGTASYLLIESPTRRISVDRRSLVLLGGSAAAVAPIFFFGVLSVATVGFPDRFPPVVRYLEGYLNYRTTEENRRGVCFIDSSSDAENYDQETCISLDPARENLLLLGDSHAAHYYAALVSRFGNYAVSQVNASGCRPLLNATGEERCVELIAHALGDILNRNSFDVVILSARWRGGDAAALRRTVDYIGERAGKVIVIGPIIEYEVPLPRLLAVTAGDSDALEQLRAARKYDRIAAIDRRLRQTLLGSGAEYHSAFTELCPTLDCIGTTPSGVPVQFDYGHLTKAGASFLLQKFNDHGFLE